jgi:hypothetical protein
MVFLLCFKLKLEKKQQITEDMENKKSCGSLDMSESSGLLCLVLLQMLQMPFSKVADTVRCGT